MTSTPSAAPDGWLEGGRAGVRHGGKDGWVEGGRAKGLGIEGGRQACMEGRMGGGRKGVGLRD